MRPAAEGEEVARVQRILAPLGAEALWVKELRVLVALRMGTQHPISPVFTHFVFSLLALSGQELLLLSHRAQGCRRAPAPLIATPLRTAAEEMGSISVHKQACTSPWSMGQRRREERRACMLAAMSEGMSRAPWGAV